VAELIQQAAEFMSGGSSDIPAFTRSQLKLVLDLATLERG